MKILGALAASALAVGVLAAAPAQADTYPPPTAVTVSAPDVDITTNACRETPVTMTITRSSPNNLYRITVTDPTGQVVGDFIGAYQADGPIPLQICSSTVEGTYTAVATVNDLEFPNGVPTRTELSDSKTFQVYKPHLDVVTAAGTRHAKKPRKVAARLVIHGAAMAHRKVLVATNGHRAYRWTNSAGRVQTTCKAAKRCRIQFSYDGFVTSRVVKVRQR